MGMLMGALLAPVRKGLSRLFGHHLGILHLVRGFPVVVDNTRPDIATADVVSRLDEALALIERYQPWRLAHLTRDLDHIHVMRYACRGAHFPEQRACMVELTFLARRDIGPATVAATIVHEGMHARIHAWMQRSTHDTEHTTRARSREERVCRRAELEFGQALPPAIGEPVVARALESLALADAEVAPDIDWELAQERIAQVDRGARS